MSLGVIDLNRTLCETKNWQEKISKFYKNKYIFRYFERTRHHGARSCVPGDHHGDAAAEGASH